MPLLLTSPDTIACVGRNSCGDVHEVGPAQLKPVYSIDGEVAGLCFNCRCGNVMAAPRMSPDEAWAALADPSVAWARRMWRRLVWARERELRTEPELAALEFAHWPVPPGDHSLHLAALWRQLDELGWPDPDDRARRHEQALERWPVTSEEA